jgi:hypothetical protein
MGCERRRVEPIDPHREVIHVAPGSIRRIPRRSGCRNEIDQRRACAQLYELWLIEPALDMAIQDVLVKRDCAVEIADPKHDVVEAGDGHRGSGAFSFLLNQA